MAGRENLTAEIDNYALYLPAVPFSYIRYVVGTPESTACPILPADLNFLNGLGCLWSYRWCLGSAGALAYANGGTAITQRDPATSWVMGDSGGFQVATGALKETKPWKAYARDPKRIAQLWGRSRIARHLLRWLEQHCDYATTLDMPLWVKSGRYRSSPFHYCSLGSLTDLTVENLRYIERHRGAVGDCKFVNVIQGRDNAEEDYWYERVREFDFEGWALGGSVNWSGGLGRVLRRLLIMRDEGRLGGRRQWLHILGNSLLSWGIALTAIQRAIQANTGGPFTASFDSSTPFLWAGKYQTYPIPPKLTRDVSTWTFSSAPFPVGYAAARAHRSRPIPPGSPLSERLTLGDLNTKTSAFAAQTFGSFGTAALGNHNLYVFLRAFIRANKLVFGGGPVPQEIADMVGVIGDLFTAERWMDLLLGKRSRLDARGRRPAAVLNGDARRKQEGRM